MVSKLYVFYVTARHCHNFHNYLADLKGGFLTEAQEIKRKLVILLSSVASVHFKL